MVQRYRAQLLWAQRYAGHVLLDLYVPDGGGVGDAGPAVSILGKLPSSPWSSWHIKSFLHHWAKASELVEVEVSTKDDRESLLLSCDGLELVLTLDH